MSTYPSNRVFESDCPTKAGFLRHPVFAIALIAGGLNISAARADNTWVRANMTFPATASCDLNNCTTASGTVIIRAVNLRGCRQPTDLCELQVDYSFNVGCAPSPKDGDPRDLHANQSDDCAGDLPPAANLLAAPPTISREQWDSMAKSAMSPRALGDWVIVADLGPLDPPFGSAIASGNPLSIDDIPTLSEWAVVWMTLLLVVTGTILFGRSSRRAPTA